MTEKMIDLRIRKIKVNGERERERERGLGRGAARIPPETTTDDIWKS
jgi:hypothetical protein